MLCRLREWLCLGLAVGITASTVIAMWCCPWQLMVFLLPGQWIACNQCFVWLEASSKATQEPFKPACREVVPQR